MVSDFPECAESIKSEQPDEENDIQPFYPPGVDPPKEDKEIHVIRHHHFTIVGDPLIMDARLSVFDKTVFVTIAKYANKDRPSWPTIRRLATIIKCSPMTVQNSVKRLKKLKYLDIQPQYRQGKKRAANIYILHDLEKSMYQQMAHTSEEKINVPVNVPFNVPPSGTEVEYIEEEHIEEQNNCVVFFESKTLGRITFDHKEVSKLGKEKIKQAIKYIDHLQKNVRNPKAYITAAIIGKWDLSVPEKEDTITQTKKWLQEQEEIRRKIEEEKKVGVPLEAKRFFELGHKVHGKSLEPEPKEAV